MVIVNDEAQCRSKDQNCFFRSQSEKIVLYGSVANPLGSIKTVIHLVVTAIVTVVTTVTAALAKTNTSHQKSDQG